MSLGRSPSFFNSEFIFYQRTNGKAGFWDYHNGHGFRNNSTSQSNAILDDNTWKHVAFVKSGTVGKFYINGSLDRTVSAAKNVTSLNSNFFYIGGDVRDSNSWLSGKIASAKLYTAALSASDILYDFNSSNALYNSPPSYLATPAQLWHIIRLILTLMIFINHKDGGNGLMAGNNKMLPHREMDFKK